MSTEFHDFSLNQDYNNGLAISINLTQDNPKNDAIEKQKQSKRLNTFRKNLGAELYENILANEDITTKDEMKEKLIKIAYNYKNPDAAFRFFIEINEYEQLCELIYNKFDILNNLNAYNDYCAFAKSLFYEGFWIIKERLEFKKNPSYKLYKSILKFKKTAEVDLKKRLLKIVCTNEDTDKALKILINTNEIETLINFINSRHELIYDPSNIEKYYKLLSKLEKKSSGELKRILRCMQKNILEKKIKDYKNELPLIQNKIQDVNEKLQGIDNTLQLELGSWKFLHKLFATPKYLDFHKRRQNLILEKDYFLSKYQKLLNKHQKLFKKLEENNKPEKREKLKTFKYCMTKYSYEKLLQNEDFAARDNMQKKLFKIAHHHRNIDNAFKFFIEINEPQELTKLIYNRHKDFEGPTYSYHNRYYTFIEEQAMEVDERASLLLRHAAGDFYQAYDCNGEATTVIPYDYDFCLEDYAHLSQEKKIIKFKKNLSYTLYKNILEGADIRTREILKKRLLKIAYDYKDRKKAFSFFIIVNEPQKIIKFIMRGFVRDRSFDTYLLEKNYDFILKLDKEAAEVVKQLLQEIEEWEEECEEQEREQWRREAEHEASLIAELDFEERAKYGY